MTDIVQARGKVAVIGSGLIGRSFAMLFAESGFHVEIFDVDSAQSEKALELIKQQFIELEERKLKKKTTTAEEDCSKISIALTLSDCVSGAIYVQECVPEVRELKNKVHREIDEVLEDGAILASSTSFMIPSGLFEELKHRNQAVVVHPTNPPYFVPFTEIVPSLWTEKWVIDKSKQMLLDAELSPVVLKKEIEGFALNRIQYAMFMESYHLVQENILSVEDVDKVMTDGLGRRFAFIGPWESAHLNSEGIVKNFNVYSNASYEIQKTFKPVKMGGEVAERMERELCERVPLEDLEKRRKWRDEALIRLSKLKRDVEAAKC